MNILYLEDHAKFARDVTRHFLASHSVTIVPSLSGAREALMTQAFDVLLVDYDLGDGKGEELVRELRSKGSSMVIIGVSSHEEGNAAMVNSGANGACVKQEFDKVSALMKQFVKGLR